MSMQHLSTETLLSMKQGLEGNIQQAGRDKRTKIHLHDLQKKLDDVNLELAGRQK